MLTRELTQDELRTLGEVFAIFAADGRRIRLQREREARALAFLSDDPNDTVVIEC